MKYTFQLLHECNNCEKTVNFLGEDANRSKINSCYNEIHEKQRSLTNVWK